MFASAKTIPSADIWDESLACWIEFWVKIYWLPATAPLIMRDAMIGAAGLYRKDRKCHQTGELNLDRMIAGWKARITE